MNVGLVIGLSKRLDSALIRNMFNNARNIKMLLSLLNKPLFIDHIFSYRKIFQIN